MEVDVKAGRFLEHGEYDGNLYGTKIESIHEVVATGRTCILDVNPQVRSGLFFFFWKGKSFKEGLWNMSTHISQSWGSVQGEHLAALSGVKL